MIRAVDNLPLRRAGVLLLALLLFLSLSIAPAVHGKICDDVCARQAANAHAPCHGGDETTDCQCVGDCCSAHACCVTPPEPSDVAPPSPLPARADAPDPEKTPRAPGARLLPYPTGPPPVA